MNRQRFSYQSAVCSINQNHNCPPLLLLLLLRNTNNTAGISSPTNNPRALEDFLPQFQDSQKAERPNTMFFCATIAEWGNVSCPWCPFPALPQRPGRQIQVISQPSASLPVSSRSTPASLPPSLFPSSFQTFVFFVPPWQDASVRAVLPSAGLTPTNSPGVFT